MMKKLLPIIVAAVLALAFGGCTKDEDYENFLTFHIAEQKSAEGVSRSKVTMPLSGFEIIANDTFSLSHAHLDSVQPAQRVSVDGTQKVVGLLFSFNQEGTKILYRETATHRNGWILMNERYEPVGLCKIEKMISDGTLFVIVEFPPETDLQEKADDYNEGIKIVQKKIAKKKNSMFAGW